MEATKGKNFSELLEASLKVHIFLRLCCFLKTPFWCICPIGFCVSVHETHVVNNVSPFLPEVTNQKVAILFCSLWLLCS